MEGKYLITTDDWFVAPNGMQYKAAWGEVEVLSDSILGLKTNARSTNWYAKIGSKDNHIIVAGCQIHYAVKSEGMPDIDKIDDWCANADKGLTEFKTPTKIYIAE